MPLCNACDFDGPTSEEHLWHTGILRAVIGDPQLRRKSKQRAQLLAGYELYVDDRQTPAECDVDVDRTIDGLLCEPCNNGWANQLEQKAGRSLTGFLWNEKPLDHLLLRRWAAFMALKVWWALAPNGPDDLPRGVFRPVLTVVRKPECNVQMPVRIGRVHPYPYVEAACHHPTTKDGGFTRWRVGALLFYFPIPGNGPDATMVWPALLRELDRDYRLEDLPDIPKPEFARLIGLV